MHRSREIAEFVSSFLAAHGIAVTWNDGNRLEAQLDESLAKELGTGRWLRLRFSPNTVKTRGWTPGEELIDLGHPLLDRMLELAKKRGQAACLLLTAGLEPSLLHASFTGASHQQEADQSGEERANGWPPALERCLSKFSFPNATVRSQSKRLVYHTQVLFHFKVSLLSDEKLERIVSVWIDPVTEAIDRPVDVRRSLSFYPAREGNAAPIQYRLERLYRQALNHLEKRLKSRVAAYEEGLNRRKQRELHRIEEYYQGLLQERVEPIRKLFRKMAVASVRADLARSWSTEWRYRETLAALKQESRLLEAQYEKDLAQLQREKEQRIQEVQEKYRTRVEARLTHAALVMVPRLEWRLQLAGRAQRELTLLYDLLRRREVGWECESCAASMREGAFLCDCASVICQDCYAVCRDCGRGVCRSCSDATCHLCQRPLCPDCPSPCPLGLDSARELRVCAQCREEVCPACIRLSAFCAEGAVH